MAIPPVPGKKLTRAKTPNRPLRAHAVGRKAKVDHPHRVLHRVLVGVNVFLAVCVVSAAAGYGYLKFRLGQLDRISFGCGVLRNCGDDDPGEPMNVLLVGSDTRANISKAERGKFGNEGDVGGERTDTMMVLHIDPQAEKASILSIPRDLYVKIAGTGITDRINTAYALHTTKRTTTTSRASATTRAGALNSTTIPASQIKDGPSRLIATIKQELGVEIDHYIEVDFNGFRAIVNAVGGVTVPFPAPARDKLAGLDVKQAGCVSLSGDQALGYVRSRHFQSFESGKWHSDPTGDIGRISRQQDFIRRMLGKAISRGARNPIKLNALIGAGIDNVRIDSALSSKDILRVGTRFRSLAPEAVDMVTLPTSGFRTSAGASVLKLKTADAREIIDRFNGLTQPEPTTGSVPPIAPATVRVLVLNGTGINGQAGKTLHDLTNVGFTAGGSGDAPAGFNQAKTKIRYGTGQLQKAQLLQAYVIGGGQLISDPTLKGGNIELTLGAGFGGVRSKVGGTTSSVPATTSTTRGAKPASKGAATLDC
ncbi:MAG: hypothetical protein QOF21_2483 [Actinomycetota bacterium]